MTLDIVKLQTTWNDAAGSINSNYAKIADAIAQLKANGGGGGGGADIDLTDYASKVWVEAQGYITASALTPYALKTDIPSLAGYATEVFVNNKLNAYTTTEDLAENYASKNDLETAINNIDLSPYLKTEDAKETYATKDYVTTKLVDYAPLTSVQGFENRIGGLEGAVPQLNERVETVESKVATLNEYVVTGDNSLLNRVTVIEQEYATYTYVDNAIDGIDLSPYLLKADLTKSRIQSTLGISDWALTVTKPSYAWSEITSRPTALSQFTDDVVAGKYLPLSGGTMTGDIYLGSAPSLDDPCLRKNISFIFTNGWARSLAVLAVDSKLKFHIGGYGVYYAGASDNELNGYAYIGCNNYDGLNLRITPSSIKWGDYDLIHSNNISSQSVNYATNAGSTTKLATPRKLWGNDFDGSAHIGGDITLDAFQDGRQLSIQQSGEIKFSTPPDNGWVTSLSIYASDKTTLLTSAFGAHGTSEDVQYAFIGGTYDHPNVVVQDDTGYVGIGTINPEERLHVIGTIKSGNLSVSNQIDVKTIVGKGFGLYSSDTNPYLELNQNGKVAYLQMMGDNGMVALGSTASKSLVVNAAGFVSVNRGYVNPTEALDVGGNILASGNINATSITINGVTITASNGTITVNGNVFAKGDITGGV